MAEKAKKSDEYNELSLDELLERRKQMLELLAHLEDEYRTAAVSEASYKQAKGSNLKKLDMIKKKLEEFGIKDEDAPQAPAAPKFAEAPKSPPAPQVSSAAPQANATAPAQSQASPHSPPPAIAPAKSAASEQQEPEPEPPASSTPSAPVPPPSAPPSQPSAVGILRRIISPSSFSSPAAVQVSESDLHKVDEKYALELERIKATIDAIKEARAAADERMQRMTESVAELRSMMFQRETTLKGYDIKIEKISEAMADIDPQKIAKDFGRRDKAAAESDARIEKLERKTEDMMRTISETNALLKSIGGLQNIAEVDHAIAKKMEKMSEMLKSVERFSEKTERMFLEVNKRLEEFTIYKAKQESMEEIVRDLLRNVDRMGVKFESYLEKKELVAFREKADGLEKQFEAMKKALKKAVPFIDSEIPKELLDIQKEKDDISALIVSITSAFEQKRLSEADYKKIIEKNQAKLADIEKRLSDASARFIESEKEKAEASSARPSGEAEKEQKALKKESKEAPAEKAPPAAPEAQNAANAAPKSAEAPKSTPAPQVPSAAPQAKEKPAEGGISFGGFGKKAPEDAAKRVVQKPDEPPAEKDEEEGLQKSGGSQEKAADKASDKTSLIAELDASLKEGLITKEAFERAKKMIMEKA